MIRCLILISLLVQASLAQSDGVEPAKPAAAPRKWPTLSGYPPLVIARGGFSGLFPESTALANDMALQLRYTDVALLCNLQLTRDSVGICVTDIRLDNSTNIAELFPKDSKTYNINGHDVKGWFAKDFASQVILNNVSMIQSVLSRPSAFDNQLPVGTIYEVREAKPEFFWLNVQYDAFYTANKLSMSNYIEKTIGFKGINYISSPEIGFLRNMKKRAPKEISFIFVCLGQDVVEPTENKKYSDILKDLNAIKAFATGIMVPKEFIWPVGENNYLHKPTTLVTDAHKAGLEVYASGLSNDQMISHNYSYDPTAEILNYVNYPEFTVDGLVTDFSPIASNAIACFATNETKKEKQLKTLIITHNGASGVYPGCTDLAYERAVNDGADIIDCSVQLSKDGVAFCSDSADLTGDTTAMPTFMSKSSLVPEVQKDKGVFSFDLTWAEIQTLKPQMYSPFGQRTGYYRNPAAKNKGKFMTLNDFLEFAKTKEVEGVLINIENAAYLASKKGLDIIDTVNKALKNASLDKVKVMIQSDNSSVLKKYSSDLGYKRLLHLKNPISKVAKSVPEEIKKFADAVVVPRPSLIEINEGGFTKATTNVLKEMHDVNVSVYVSVMRNEFVAIPFDFYADPTMELATYNVELNVDGFVTEFPATASRYLRSSCVDMNADVAILPAKVGALLQEIPENTLPAVQQPSQPLDVKDLASPPIPPVKAPTAGGSNSPPGPPGAPAPAPSSMAIPASLMFV
ncbi:Glycerophosphodiester phosphodiesterase GDPDL6 [Hibiscus syriacus]|uniref:glycerophosphodiester phosphodiesterase n=1 Tax=Hibiscus syriacus TaxID=106335 RepID=A0A6A3A9L8_HIBSY|nr:glycerophosphodiester phosphodiesterase GDPDL6-like [Hibiscus syriacus]KAE8700427.1 Glycerophosphodiester phosphodiesterase GDPDL6 [Hibiscus syriacus]